MPRSQTELAEAFYDAFNRRDLDALPEIGPDFEWRSNPIDPEQQTRRGPDEVAQTIRALWDILDVRSNPEEFIERGDELIVPVKHTGRVHGSDDTVDRREVHLWTFAEGRPVRLSEFPDLESAEAALGRG